MAPLPTNIYSVASIRAIDRMAIDVGDIAGYTLMSRAGDAAVAAARERYPDALRWQVFCGAGNNAGDGYVVARLASQQGIDVSVVALVDPGKLTGDAATAYRDCAEQGCSVSRWSGDVDADADLLIDAILGSGLERAVEGDFARAVAAINEHTAKVQALDIPTGINGDTGELMGAAVCADLTTTFVGLKAGLFLGQGPEFSGALTFDELGISPECRASVPALYRLVDDELLRRELPHRDRQSHKGDFGHVLVVGGGPGMPGAARLCGEAALRVGAGRVTVATHPGNTAQIAAGRAELMVYGVDTGDGSGGGTALLVDLLATADVVAFGPGLGQSDWAKRIYGEVSQAGITAVWDADALNMLSKSTKSVENRVITPHPGEAATLLSESIDTVQSNRRAAAEGLQRRYGGVAVLKGAGTLVADDTDAPYLCIAGNPGMATAGMGDVLTGCVAGLAAQGLALNLAAAVGVKVHARAADRAAAGGERGMLASDVIAALRRIVNP